MLGYGTVGHWDTEKEVMSNTNQVELIAVGQWDSGTEQKEKAMKVE